MGDEFYDRGGGDYFDIVAPDVKEFIKNFNRRLHACDVFEIQNLYEIQFQNLTEKFFKGSPWPSAEAVKNADIIDSNDENFLILYKELYFRHIYSKLAPSISDRFDSFVNYTNLFNILLALDPTKPELELPTVWLWDIMDEFIYQFRTFHQLRARPDVSTGPQEIKRLKEAPHLWSAQTVCAYLDRMIKKGADANVHPFFKSMRDYCLIGMTRVHCLMGDYYSALETSDAIDFDGLKSGKTIGPYSALAYYVSFSYLMLRRYSDAITMSSELLVLTRRLRLEESVPKAMYQCNGIIAIARHMAPQSLEDSVSTSLREKFGERLEQMKRNDEAVREIFDEVAPRFISACVPDYDAGIQDNASRAQTNVFMTEVHQRRSDVHKMLKLCTTISMKELCALASKEPATLTAELISTKIKNKNVSRAPGDLPSQGTPKLSSPVNFFIKDDFVHVAQAPHVDRYGDYFLSQFLQYDYMLQETREIH